MRLGPILRKWRITHEMPVRDLANMIGVTPATLARFENEKEITTHNFVKLLTWLTQPTTLAAHAEVDEQVEADLNGQPADQISLAEASNS